MGYGDVLISWISWKRAFYILLAFSGGFAVGANVPYEWIEPFAEQVFDIDVPNGPSDEFNDISVEKPVFDAERPAEQPNTEQPNEQELLPWERPEHFRSDSPDERAGS